MAQREHKAQDTSEEYRNQTRQTGLTGDYGAKLHRTEYGGHTDKHGVFHAGVQNIHVYCISRQSDKHDHHTDLTGEYGHRQTHQNNGGVSSDETLGAPGTTGAYPTTANIPYAGSEVGVGETEKSGPTGTIGAYPTKENVPYGGADIGTGDGYRQSDNSSSNSSEEDDGVGGRRKKGLKEELKEKLPGGHKDMPPEQAISTTAPRAYHVF